MLHLKEVYTVLIKEINVQDRKITFPELIKNIQNNNLEEVYLRRWAIFCDRCTHIAKLKHVEDHGKLD